MTRRVHLSRAGALLALLALAACEAPLPGRGADEEARRWPTAEWRDDNGNVWDAKVDGGKLTAKGVGGSAIGLTLAGAFAAGRLPYEITLPDGQAIATGEARLVDGEHAMFATTLIDGRSTHGLLHFNHPPTTASMLEALGGQTLQMSALSGAWMDDGGDVWAVTVDKDGKLLGVGASGGVIGAKLEGAFAGGALRYTVIGPDGTSAAGEGTWDGGCHVTWKSLAATELLETSGQLHVNHAPGETCEGELVEAAAPGDGAVPAVVTDPDSARTAPIGNEGQSAPAPN